MIRLIKTRWCFITFAALCTCAPVIAAQGAEPDVVQQLGCFNCHLGARSSNPFAGKIPNLRDAGARYQNGFLHALFQRTQARRQTGRPGRMPKFQLATDERTALVQYLGTQRDAAAASKGRLDAAIGGLDLGSTGAVDRGRALFRSTYACVGCHRMEGQGGTAGPELDQVDSKLRPKWVHRFLADPKGVDPTSTMLSLFFRRNGKGAYVPVRTDRNVRTDLSDLVAYLFKGKAPASTAPAAGRDDQAGGQIFAALRCASCHRDAKPKQFAPDLSTAAQRLTPAFLKRYLKTPYARRPFGVTPGHGGRMPNFELSEKEIGSVAKWMQKNAKGKSPLPKARPKPTLSKYGAWKAERLLREKMSCLGCHRWGEDGGRVAPQLRGAGGRLSARYLSGMVFNPRKTAPHSVMPKVKGRPTPKTLESIYGLLAMSVDQEPQNTPYLSLTKNQTTSAADPKTAAGLYGRYCAMCHGADGKGSGFNAGYLKPRPADLSNAKDLSADPDDTLFDVISVGGFVLGKSHRMPPWGETLSRAQIRLLVAHIRKLCQCTQPKWAGDGR